jgi:NDP-sugar pyrophosphorylase family protein
MQARTIQQVPVLDADGKPIGLHLIHELVGALTRPNWAVIMAGGKGSRLGGITQHVPKPMLPVAGRPILERLVLHLVGFGFRRIYLSVNYMAHVIEEHFGAGERFGCEIRYLREEKPLGTGGSLSLLPEIPTDSLLVLNGDLVTQADIGALLRFHEYGGYQCTVAVRQYCHAVPFGCLRVEDGMIVEIEEKPLITRLINAGMYVMEPAALSLIPINQEFPITELLGRLLQEAQPVGAFELMGDWIDVGLPEQLKVARHGWT